MSTTTTTINNNDPPIRIAIRPTTGYVLRRNFQDEILEFSAVENTANFYQTLFLKYDDYSLLASLDKDGNNRIEKSKSTKLSQYHSSYERLDVYLHSMLKFKPTDHSKLIMKILTKESPVVGQKKNKNCNHPQNQKCLHCLDIYAWDEKYLKDDGTGHKYLPFSLHVHKLMYDSKISIKDINKFKLPDSPRYSVDTSCKGGHAPWPNGSCGRCMPKNEHLHHQHFRMVDSVVLNSGDVIDRFLEFWRISGSQQVGFLIGKLEKSAASPYAVQARVHSIYRPRQIDSLNFVEMESYPEDDPALCYLLQKLDMHIVGMVLTDLVQHKDDEGNLVFKNYRNNDSYLISAEECLVSAFHQLRYPFKTSLSKSGKFGSCFVNIILTGDKNGHVDMEAYQVSNQCMDLVKAKVVLPTRDAPDYATIRDPVSAQDFVPEIKYSTKQNSSTVHRIAKPFPVDYLYVTMPCAFDKELKESYIKNDLSYSFIKLKALHSNAEILREMKKAPKTEMLNDIDILHLLTKCDEPNFYRNIDIIIDKAHESSIDQQTCDNFFECELFNAPNESASKNSAQDLDTWNCTYCTFINPLSEQSCQMCALPKAT